MAVDGSYGTLHKALMEEDKATCHLIEKGTDVNSHNSNKHTVLMLAARCGRDECVGLLIKAGANVNKSDIFGETATMESVSNGHVECARLLLEASADVNCANKGGETALMKAVVNRPVECLRLLLDAGVDVNKADKAGQTALMIAASYGLVECLRMLLEAGAGVNDTDINGETALIYCLTPFHCTQRESCLKLLINAGADINAQNNKNLQPIHFALSRWQCVKFPAEYLISENCYLCQTSYDKIVATFDEDWRTESEDYLTDEVKLDILKLLLACGLLRHLCQSFIVEQETSVRKWVETVVSQPNTLKSVCIFNIRRSLGLGIKSKVTKLNLPTAIQSMILLKGILSLQCFD